MGNIEDHDNKMEIIKELIELEKQNSITEQIRLQTTTEYLEQIRLQTTTEQLRLQLQVERLASKSKGTTYYHNLIS